MKNTEKKQLPQAVRMAQIRDYFNISQVKLASIIGAGSNVIKMIEQSRTKTIEEKHLKSLEEKLSISSTWLVEGKGDMFLEDTDLDEILSSIDKMVNSLNPSLIEIPFYIDLSMQDKTTIQITKDFLPSLVAKKHIKAVQVCDNAMHPTIKPKDIILINTSETDIQEGKIYLIHINSKPYIKRIFENPLTNELIISQDNQAHPKLNIPKSKIAVIGKIFGNISINNL